jgi:gliding motility-associated-like protein
MATTTKPLWIVIGLLFCTQMLSAADYYWVGGSGNWSDLSHWATTSGGSTRHPQIPTADDRVFFDALSFNGAGQTVTVNNQSIFCKDMSWVGATGNPQFVAPASYVMNVSGSLQLIANMGFNFKGNVNFQAKSMGNQIDLAGQRLKRLATFAGTGGQWTLTTAFNVDSTLIINDGSLNTNGQAISCELLTIQAVNAINLDFGASMITVTGVAYRILNVDYEDRPVIDIYPNKVSISAANSIIDLTSANAYLRIRSNGAFALGSIRFSNTIGNSRLLFDSSSTPSFTKVQINNDASIKGASAKLGELVLGPGKTFQFQGGSTYDLSKLTAQGQCITPIQLVSTSSGSAVTFRSTADSIKADYITLRDIAGTGTAKYIANNAADLGNNPGWVFMPKAQSALYWVGGTGSWSDAAHWSFSSGGPGGACVPTGGDDVFFDGNSFPTAGAIVMLNTENAYCRSMTWTGSTGRPLLMGALDRNLHIFGSLTFISNMVLDFSGDIYFESGKPGNTINTAGKVFKKDGYFDGSGDWTLQDSLIITRELFFNQGGLNTNSKLVACELFNSSNGAARKLTLGSTHWEMRFTPRYYYLYFYLNAENLSFDAGNSVIDFKFSGGITQYGRNGSLKFNRVIYRGSGALSSYYPGRVTEVDSLTSYGDTYFYAINKVNVWEIVNVGYSQQIYPTDTLSVNQIINASSCQGMVELRSSLDDQTAYLDVRAPISVTNFILKDVNAIGPGSATANSSIDLGNTTGWVINKRTGRNLFWVGGTGDWNDPNHWSLSSGGAGGECIPTPEDNVFFDARSFNGPNQFVRSPNLHAYCKNMLWDAGVVGNPILEMQILHCFASLTLTPNMKISYFNALFLRSKATDNIVNTQNFLIANVYPAGSGAWRLTGPLNTNNISQSNGTFNSDGQTVNTNYYWAYGSTNSMKLQLGSSHWYINGTAFTYTGSWNTYKITVEPGTSLIEFTSDNAWLQAFYDLTFHNVLFSNVTGGSKITFGDTYVGAPKRTGTYNLIEFRNNGTMIGENVVDSLLFSAGKSYRLDVVQKQVIKKYFQVIGNNCSTIELSSTVSGTKSIVEMNSGTIKGDFIQMRDQKGVGSVKFYAGKHSTNIGNSNENWVFDAPSDFVDEGILGKDVVLCKNQILVLDANTFSPGEKYRWSNGSTNAQLTVSTPGVYWVDLTYANSCVIRDSVKVLAPASFNPNLPNDTILCAGEKLLLNADVKLVGVKYVWQDSTKLPTYTVSTSGKYKVSLELSGCKTADSLNVTVNPLPKVNLGPDQTLCQGQSATLNATTTGGTYQWQDNSTSPTFKVTQPGTYSVALKVGRCLGRDTVVVNYQPAIGLELGRDTSFCENSSFIITANVSNVTYRWNDASTNNSLLVKQPGTYRLSVTRSGCTETDSIKISQQPLPKFNLGRDTVLCEGQKLTLNGAVTGGTYLWNDNSKLATLTASTAGLYWLEVLTKGCKKRDSINIKFTTIPNNILGKDSTLCDGQSFGLKLNVLGAAYVWQDGTTLPTYTVRQTGRYTVQVKVGSCTKTDTLQATFNPLPKFDLGRDTVLCEGQKLTLNGTVAGASYQWNDGLTQPTRIIQSTGLYWLEEQLSGCKKRDSIKIQFTTIPNQILGRDTSLCDGQIYPLKLSVPGAVYQWQDGTSSNQFTIKQAGTFTVKVSLGNCGKSDTLIAKYNPLPRFDLGRDTALCQGESLNLNMKVVADLYRWENGSPSSSRGVAATGVYIGKATLKGCSFSDTIKIDVKNLSTINLGKDTLVCDDHPLVLTSNVKTGNLLWSDGSTGTTLETTVPGIYWLKISEGRCQKTDTVKVTFRHCVVFQLYAPNAFSPNKDNVNDVFLPGISPEITVMQYSMLIFNRWGNLIFETEDYTQGWDGTAGHKDVPDGVYIYVIQLKYRDDKGEGSKKIAGDVTLIH